MKSIKILFGIIAMVFICHPLFSSESFQTIKVLDSLNHPWSFVFLPDEEGILITERPGKMILFQDGYEQEIQGLPAISPGGQGGLLDVILDNHFHLNRTIYFSYSEAQSFRRGTAVAKARLEGNQLLNVQILFRADPKSRGGLHFGSRLLMTPDGYLYITLGERGTMENAQDLNHHGGSVVRINPDGSIPQDNPFINDPNRKSEIFSYGHRNPQGIAYHPERGEVWIHEHGPKGGDEVNILIKGANYGWPLVTYGINYNGAIISEKTSMPGVEEPVLYWDPSIAPSGMSFYWGDKFPQWKGNLFVGALAGKQLRRIVLDGRRVISQEILLGNEVGRIRDVRVGPDDAIYILTDSVIGALYRLEQIDE